MTAALVAQLLSEHRGSVHGVNGESGYVAACKCGKPETTLPTMPGAWLFLRNHQAQEIINALTEQSICEAEVIDGPYAGLSCVVPSYIEHDWHGAHAPDSGIVISWRDV